LRTAEGSLVTTLTEAASGLAISFGFFC